MISNSTTEAEYYALGLAGKEVEYLRNLLESIGLEQTAPTLLNYDNTGSAFLAANETTNPKTKHIAVKYHYIRDLISRSVLYTRYCQTKIMLADIFTKPLGLKVHNGLKTIVMNLKRSTDLFSFTID